MAHRCNDNQTEIGPELLTVAELAVRLKVRPSWVYLHAAELGAIKLGKYVRFRWDLVLVRLTGAGNPALSSGPKTNDPRQTLGIKDPSRG